MLLDLFKIFKEQIISKNNQMIIITKNNKFNYKIIFIVKIINLINLIVPLVFKKLKLKKLLVNYFALLKLNLFMLP